MTITNIDNLQSGVSAYLKHTNCLNFFRTYEDNGDGIKIKKYCDKFFPIYNRCVTDSESGFIPNPDLKPELFKNNTDIKGSGYFINFIEPINYEYPHKQKNNLKLPLNIMIDIDLKNENVFTLLKKDTGIEFKNIDEGLEYIYNSLKADNKCLYLDYSFSGQGIKAILTFISDIYKDLHKTYKSTYDELSLILDKLLKKEKLTKKEAEKLEEHKNYIDFLQKNNFTALCEYVSKFNLKYHPDSDFNYIDNCSGKATQGTYQSKGLKTIINPAYVVNYYEIDKANTKKFKDIAKYIHKQNKSNLNGSNITALNEEFIHLFKEHYLKADKTEKARIKTFLHDKIFAHKNRPLSLPLLYSLHFVQDDDLIRYFYNMMVSLNDPDSSWHKTINTFEKFKADIRNLKPAGNKTRLLADIFKEIYKIQTVQFDAGCDFMGNKYTQSITFDNKLSEKQSELFDIYDNHNKIIENAPAGSGKTTLKLIYLANLINQYPDENFIMVIPINGLLRQLKSMLKPSPSQLEKEKDPFFAPNETTLKLRKIYKDINIIENFGRGYAHHVPPRSLILSSTPKVNYFKNKPIKLLVVDEIHDLVSFSKEIKSDLPYKKVEKLMLVSATPESFLIGENLDEFAYLKCNPTNYQKKTLNWIRTDSLKYTLFNMIDPTRKQLVYLNNVNTSTNFIKQIEETSGITYSILKSNNNDEYCQEVIDTQKITKNSFATSYINAGISFINDDWDDIIILNNAITNPFDIYQLVNRFRDCKPKITFIRERHIDCHDTIRFNDINKDLGTIYQQRVKQAKELNKLAKTTNNLITDVIKVNNLRFNQNKQYEVNKDSIKLDRLNNFFFAHYYTYDDIAYDSLAYYFDIVQTEEIDIENKIPPLSNNQLLKIWCDNWSNIVQDIDYVNGLTSGDDLFNLSGTTEIDMIVNNNLDFFNKKCRQYTDAIFKHDMDNNSAAAITFKSDRYYKSELEKHDIKRILTCNKDDNGAAEYVIRDRIDKFKNEIAGLPMFHLKTKNIDVYKVKHIMRYFEQSNTAGNYLNVEGCKLFSHLDQKSMTRFLNKYVGKCFKSKIDGCCEIVLCIN